MQTYTISRDDRYHEAWPSICMAANGNLVCSYAEADRHGGGALPSAIVRISEDEGATWSEAIPVETLMDRPEAGYIMCRSIIRLLDDSLLLAVDWNKTESIRGVSERWYAHRGLPWNWNFDPISGHNAEALLYRSFDNGVTWTGPERTGCLTTSLNVRQISDGTLFLSGTHFRCEGLSEDQVFFRSTDNGRTWSDAIQVTEPIAAITGEADLVEMPGGELITYIRSDDNPSGVGMKSISTDGGLTWEGPFAAGYWPTSGRINAGLLSTGEVMVTHRVGGFHPQAWFGYFIEEPETAIERIPNEPEARLNPPASVWGMIDNDTSPHADHGYGDWIELPNGDVYVVNYIVDNAPEDRPQIRGYRLSRDDLVRQQERELLIDFSAPTFRRGKLAGQAGWVQQRPELWDTTEWLEDPGADYLGNYVVVDPKEGNGSSEFTITGSRNRGGNEEVVRRDIGPYDLLRENVEVTMTHRGRQRVAIVRLVDERSKTIVELRSDHVYNDIWARDQRSYFYHSGIETSESWWETRFLLTGNRVEVSTAAAGDVANGPWAVIEPDDRYEHSTTLCAVVAALGDEGGFYIDRLTARVIDVPT